MAHAECYLIRSAQGLVADWDLDEGALDLAPELVEWAVVVLAGAAAR
jgi:hypothetical protein